MPYFSTKIIDEFAKFSPQISKEPVHVYDEIDESMRVLNKTSQKAQVKHLKEDTSEKCNRYQSEVEFQKKRLESKQQISVSSPEDPEAPELPNREYLTDIDFVAQEFDLLLRRAPELPKRKEDSTNILTSTDATEDDKEPHHGTQQFLIRQELERSVGMTPKSALPRKHNITKGSNSKVLAGTSQSQEQMTRKLPGEIKARNQGSGYKHCASSAHQQPLQKPTGMRPLPYRQPIRAEQLLPVSGNDNLDTCPTYQNVTEEEHTYDNTVTCTVDYQNVTSNVQQSEMSYQNILSKQKQQIREETATYQPLIFHFDGTEEDEYMEMDMI